MAYYICLWAYYRCPSGYTGMKPYNNFRSSRHHRDDLKGVPDHLFSHNDLTFFGDFIGKTFKLHPNMECCVRLEVACLLVVVNRKIPPSEYFFRRSGVVIHISIASTIVLWTPGMGTCSKNK
ncbi:LOW QUALITY PROTEIN: hypothetical protein YC2023_099340 [Brassica napus]